MANYEWGSDLFNTLFVLPSHMHSIEVGIIRPNGYYAFSEDYQKILEYHVADSLEENLFKKMNYFQVFQTPMNL